jgi:hypothetical protein
MGLADSMTFHLDRTGALPTLSHRWQGGDENDHAAAQCYLPVNIAHSGKFHEFGVLTLDLLHN